jgi:hypothetical protein
MVSDSAARRGTALCQNARMKRRNAVLIVLASAAAFACSAFGPQPFASEGEYRRWLGGLQISGVTAQAATTRLRDEGFACRTVSGVIRDAPDELVILCSRRATDRGCAQDQSVVLRLDWVGTMKPEAAPGMRVRDVGPALGKRDCG